MVMPKLSLEEKQALLRQRSAAYHIVVQFEDGLSFSGLLPRQVYSFPRCRATTEPDRD
jgi:hypothetical protein